MLFKGKDEGQPAKPSTCANAAAVVGGAATLQKTETNNGQAYHHRSLPPGPIAGYTAAGGGGTGTGSAAAAAMDGGDLIHLPGPLTEDAVLKALHGRFCAAQMFVSTPTVERHSKFFYQTPKRFALLFYVRESSRTVVFNHFGFFFV